LAIALRLVSDGEAGGDPLESLKLLDEGIFNAQVPVRDDDPRRAMDTKEIVVVRTLQLVHRLLARNADIEFRQFVRCVQQEIVAQRRCWQRPYPIKGHLFKRLQWQWEGCLKHPRLCIRLVQR
jgi:hypothetical protein